MIQKRDIAVSIVLTILTCGIYGIYWFICLTNDVKSASEDENLVSGGMAFLLTLITCGIYEIYWSYKMGELTKQMEEKNNVPVKDNSVLYVILDIIGLSIVNYALIQNDLNEISSK